jgi:hypothetical protein
MEYTLKSLLKRFLRGFVAGAVATTTTIVITFRDWSDVPSVLSMLGLAALAGGISGAILSIDKYLRSFKNDES